MSCGCGYQDDSIDGMDETDMMLMGGAVGGYVGAAYIDNMLVYDKDGNKKTGSLAENDDMRNAAFVAGGVALNYFMPDEPLAKGAGIGMTIYGVKEFIRTKYPTVGIKGMQENYQYNATHQRNGDLKYIGKSRSSRIDLGLDKNPVAQAQKEEAFNVVHH